MAMLGLVKAASAVSTGYHRYGLGLALVPALVGTALAVRPVKRRWVQDLLAGVCWLAAAGLVVWAVVPAHWFGWALGLVLIATVGVLALIRGRNRHGASESPLSVSIKGVEWRESGESTWADVTVKVENTNDQRVRLRRVSLTPSTDGEATASPSVLDPGQRRFTPAPGKVKGHRSESWIMRLNVPKGSGLRLEVVDENDRSYDATWPR